MRPTADPRGTTEAAPRDFCPLLSNERRCEAIALNALEARSPDFSAFIQTSIIRTRYPDTMRNKIKINKWEKREIL